MAPKKEEAQQQDLLEVVETDENGKPLNAAPEAPQGDDDNADDKGDARLSPDAKDDEADDTPDADPEREKLRQERRLRKKIMRDMKREGQAQKDRELQELRRVAAEQAERLRQLEQATSGNMEQALRERLQRAVQTYEAADQDLGLAVEAGDGKRMREALKIRDEAKEAAQAFDLQLRRLKAPPQQRQVGPDPQEARLYQDWLAKNDWYDPNQGNEESRLAMAINQTLLQEGYRPNTPAFWNELSSRSEKFIKPKRSHQRDDDDPPAPRAAARGGPPVGGSGREAAPTGKLRVMVTPERRRAMEEAGVWDDPAAREKMLRRYAEYDRNQTNAR